MLSEVISASATALAAEETRRADRESTDKVKLCTQWQQSYAALESQVSTAKIKSAKQQTLIDQLRLALVVAEDVSKTRDSFMMPRDDVQASCEPHGVENTLLADKPDRPLHPRLPPISRNAAYRNVTAAPHQTLVPSDSGFSTASSSDSSVSGGEGSIGDEDDVDSSVSKPKSIRHFANWLSLVIAEETRPPKILDGCTGSIPHLSRTFKSAKSKLKRDLKRELVCKLTNEIEAAVSEKVRAEVRQELDVEYSLKTSRIRRCIRALAKRCCN